MSKYIPGETDIIGYVDGAYGRNFVNPKAVGQVLNIEFGALMSGIDTTSYHPKAEFASCGPVYINDDGSAIETKGSYLGNGVFPVGDYGLDLTFAIVQSVRNAAEYVEEVVGEKSVALDERFESAKANTPNGPYSFSREYFQDSVILTLQEGIFSTGIALAVLTHSEIETFPDPYLLLEELHRRNIPSVMSAYLFNGGLVGLSKGMNGDIPRKFFPRELLNPMLTVVDGEITLDTAWIRDCMKHRRFLKKVNIEARERYHVPKDHNRPYTNPSHRLQGCPMAWKSKDQSMSGIEIASELIIRGVPAWLDWARENPLEL